MHFKWVVFCLGLLFQSLLAKAQKDGYYLVWSDEFNTNGPVDTSNWNFESGLVRNHELQWYQPQNAWCANGHLIIEGRKTDFPNPNYDSLSNDWRKTRKHIYFTASSINTRGKKAWQYGRFEVRAKIDTSSGLWPAFWTLGASGEWPAGGEIDIMEFYRGDVLANIATGTQQRYQPKWFMTKRPVKSLGDPQWADKFHVWRMDWDENYIAIFLDDELLNRVSLEQLKNPDGSNPFHQPHYILLNLAIGGDNGGTTLGTLFPSRFQVDYVRVYQRKK